MYNITLICTRHESVGNCNSEELEKIIRNIYPEIIFEELSETNFDKAYNPQTLYTLETSAIKLYLLTHNLIHIPVDTYERPRNHDEEVIEMHDRICGGISKEARDLKVVINQQINHAEKFGFRFLNSNLNDMLLEEIAIRMDKILEILNNDRLFEIRKREKEVINKREHEILRNIYDYSMENKYNQAILFIGSGHRKSIINKIEAYKKKEPLKLN